MLLYIFNERIIYMPGMNRMGSGFFSESGKGEEAEREVGKDYLHLHLDEKSYKTLIHKWAREMNEKFTLEEI